MSRPKVGARGGPAPTRHLSGYCNPTLPRTERYDPHARCVGCDCPCHTVTHQESAITTPDPKGPDFVPAPSMTTGPPTAVPLPPHVHTDSSPLTREQLDQLPTIDVSGVDRIYLGPDPADGPGWVAQVLRNTEGLDAALVGYDPDDWRDAARLLHQLRGAVSKLRDLDAVLVRWLYLHGEHGQHQVVDGIGAVSITRGRSKERWEVEPAVQAYVEAKLAEAEGEVPDPDELVRWVLEVMPSGTSVSLRKTALRALGLDTGDFYSSEPGSLQVGF